MSRVHFDPAFPCTPSVQYEGATLLDLFAAAALPRAMCFYNDPDAVARLCYKLAQAMIRRKREIEESKDSTDDPVT